MKVNEIYSGFKLLKRKRIDDIDSVLYEFKHLKSGANLVYLENEDTNKCFSIGFRTLPEDSTGVCHIIEHSLLCGSEKFPLKEPFVNLLKGSMATFLNAMTAYDWTIYPVASQNDKDFDNLVSVYLDAVFAPLSIKDNRPFLQEGWHLEMTDINQKPSYKGVVYNEMKGAMSSVDEQLVQATLKALYAGSGYEHNSGGDPDVIPTLTYEYYQKFYQEHYHPSNGLMYLYGKMDILAKLAYFDREYLSKYDEIPATEIALPKPLIDCNYEQEYAISETEELADNTYFSLAFALDKYENAQDLIGFTILNEALMSTNDSPLKKVLMDAKLGQEVVSSIDDDNILPSFHVYLQKSNPEAKEKFYQTFYTACQDFVNNGIDKKLLLATINNNEFRNKEMDSGRMPKGLFFAFNLLQSFNYQLPYENYLEYSRYYDYFKQELDNGYFEGLLEKYILNSKHYCLVTLKPSKTIAMQKAENMKKQMDCLYERMSSDEKKKTVELTKSLIEYQSKKDTEEELATLPKLAVEDIDCKVNSLTTELKTIDGLDFLVHEFNTNKIGYLKLYFDLKVINNDDIPYVKILSKLLGMLDTQNFKADQLQSYVKTYLGAFDFMTLVNGVSKDECMTKFSVQVSALEENIDKMLLVLDEVLNKTIFDGEKLHTHLLQLQNILRSEIIENGMGVAMDEARSSISKDGSLSANLHGVRLYRFVSLLVADWQANDVSRKLAGIAKKLFNRHNLIVSVSGNQASIDKLVKVCHELPLCDEKADYVLNVVEAKSASQALTIPAEVNYNAKAINLKDLDVALNGSFFVAEHIINYDYLWPEVRVKGGAYGCHIRVANCGDVVLGSFRDPNVSNTYNVYDDIAKYLENLDMTEEQFQTYLIGAIGNFDQPLSNNAQIQQADINYLSHITDEMRIKRKKQMLSTTLVDVKKLAEVFKRLAQMGPYYTIGNIERIKEYNQFDNVESL